MTKLRGGWWDLGSLHRTENVLPECLKFSFETLRNHDDTIRTPGYRSLTSFCYKLKLQVTLNYLGYVKVQINNPEVKKS